MSYIQIHQERVPAADVQKILSLCPFGAIELSGKGELAISAGCRMCRACVRARKEIFEFVEEKQVPLTDKKEWRGIAVAADITCGKIHPVTLELLGKAKELAAKTGDPVLCVAFGKDLGPLKETLLAYGTDELYVYDHPELEYFRCEPCTAVLEDFIRKRKPSVILVGGTTTGRALAPRTAARFRTGLTADCTMLDITSESDLEQIRPAYGGNIMAHIRTPMTRPQFATVRYKIFSIPEKTMPHGKVFDMTLPPEALLSGIAIQEVVAKAKETGIEEAEVIVAAGRGVRKKEDLAMLQELADLLNGRLASSRALVAAGWTDPRIQIGLSGRTVKPHLLIACGISGAIQFVAGMNSSDRIVAINTDPDAPIFKVAHVAITGDLYKIVPELIARIRAEKQK